MFPERVYRWLLVVYLREHRREYGELMVQLFRDRMRSDGNGFRGLVVCIEMIFDLVRAAFKEHKEEGVVMTKRKWIGTALVVVLLAGVAGVAILWDQDQSKGGVMASVMPDTKEDGAMTIFVRSDSKPGFSWTGTGSGALAEAMRQAVEEGAIDEAAADGIVQSLHNVQPLLCAGLDGVTEAVQLSVEEGVMSRELADAIQRLLSGGNSGEVDCVQPFRDGARVSTLTS